MAIQAQPSRIPEPFAGSGTKNAIPATNSQPSASQAASWASGFPPECSQPLSAGGCPVPRNDVNGALNQISQDYAFRQDGGIWAWSAQADYAANRLVLGSDGKLYWSVAQSGPNLSAGAQNPVNDTAENYWGPLKADVSGNADTASQFLSAKTITLDGDSTGSATSQGGWTIDVRRRSCILGQSDSSTTNPWYKVASWTNTSNLVNYSKQISFYVETTFGGISCGILRVRTRIGSDGSFLASTCSPDWLAVQNITVSDFVLVIPTADTKTIELWTRIDVGYMFRRFTVLSEGSRTDTNPTWTLYSFSGTGQSSAPSAGTQIVSTIEGTVLSATKLATARSLMTKLDSSTAVTFDGSAPQDAIPVTGILPVVNGGTGSSSKNFVDTTSWQDNIQGAKTFMNSLFIQAAGNNVKCFCVQNNAIPNIKTTTTESSNIYTRLNRCQDSDNEDVALTSISTNAGSIIYMLEMGPSSSYNSDWTNYGTVNGDSTGDGYHSIGFAKSASTTSAHMFFGPLGFQNNKMVSLGYSSSQNRWNGVYTSVAVNVSSDERIKRNITSISDELLDAWGDVELKQFIFDGRSRFHSGVIAQQVRDACAAHGVDISEYGLWCYDEWDAQDWDEKIVDKEAVMEVVTVEDVPAVYEDKEVIDAEAYVDEDGVAHPAKIHIERIEIAPAQTHKEEREVSPEISHIEHRHSEATDLYSIRYEELLCVEAAYQRRRADRAEARIAALEERLAALEARLA